MTLEIDLNKIDDGQPHWLSVVAHQRAEQRRRTARAAIMERIKDSMRRNAARPQRRRQDDQSTRSDEQQDG